VSDPADALFALAAELRTEPSVILPHVADPADGELAALGSLVAAGPRAAAARVEYALIVESVREGYLLHYGGGRVVVGADPDLALLAGDYLYALGLERLAALGDLDSVRELSDLISLAAQVHDSARSPTEVAREAATLWLAVVVAIGAGPTNAYERAKSALRAGSGEAGAALSAAAEEAATAAGFATALRVAADALETQ
jgi:hypothetical protein